MNNIKTITPAQKARATKEKNKALEVIEEAKVQSMVAAQGDRRSKATAKANKVWKPDAPAAMSTGSRKRERGLSTAQPSTTSKKTKRTTASELPRADKKKIPAAPAINIDAESSAESDEVTAAKPKTQVIPSKARYRAAPNMVEPVDSSDEQTAPSAAEDELSGRSGSDAEPSDDDQISHSASQRGLRAQFKSEGCVWDGVGSASSSGRRSTNSSQYGPSDSASEGLEPLDDDDDENDDDDDDELHMRASKSKTMKSKGEDRRRLARAAESVQWKAPSFVKEEFEQPELHSNLTAANTHWPAVTQIWGPAGSSMPIKQQSAIIQDVLREGINRVLRSIVFVHAFPSRTECDVTTGGIMVGVAREQHQEEIAQRLEEDPVYAREFCKVSDERISIFRRGLKKECDTSVKSYYTLQSGCSPRVAALVTCNQYIFPGDVMKNNGLKMHQPYGHPIFVSILSFFFRNPSSIGCRNYKSFKNSVPGGDPDEKELPWAMLALVATGIHCAIKEWTDGTCTPAEFSLSRSLDIYKSHLATLKGIKNPLALHRLLADLYKMSCNSTSDTTIGIPDIDQASMLV